MSLRCGGTVNVLRDLHALEKSTHLYYTNIKFRPSSVAAVNTTRLYTVTF